MSFEERAARALYALVNGGPPVEGKLPGWSEFIPMVRSVVGAMGPALADQVPINIPGAGQLTARISRKNIPVGPDRGKVQEERTVQLKHAVTVWKGKPYDRRTGE